MKILEILKKHWETAQFLTVGIVLFLTSVWDGIIHRITGYSLNENVMIIGIGVLVTSGALMIVVTLLKQVKK
jgi:hypothetical protein